MARKSLRPQLNQIRAWVQQGRTDAWIAHQLEVSASQLRDFRRRHGLDPDAPEGGGDDVDLRDEIEAEIEAAEAAEAERRAEQDARGEEDAPETEGDDDDDAEEELDENGEPRRKRRRRRGGRGRGRRRRRRPGAGMEATLEHGDGESGRYGLFLDATIKDDPIYAEHWAETETLRVTFEPDRIVLERPRDPDAEGAEEGDDAPRQGGDRQPRDRQQQRPPRERQRERETDPEDEEDEDAGEPESGPEDQKNGEDREGGEDGEDRPPRRRRGRRGGRGRGGRGGRAANADPDRESGADDSPSDDDF
jgi:hypothetical protein